MCSISWIDSGEYTTPPAVAPSSFMRKWFPSFHNRPQDISLQHNKHEWQSAIQRRRCSQNDHRDQHLETGDVCIFSLHSTKRRLWRKGAVVRHINRLERISDTCRIKTRIWGSFLKLVRKVCEMSKIVSTPKLITFPWIQHDWRMSLLRTLALAAFYSYREH